MAKYYNLDGQTAVVTGGSTGLGLAITRCLVSAGARVVVLSFEAPEQAAEALAEFGDRVAFYQFDITDTAHTQEMADRIAAEQGPVTILVNNAGNHCKKYIWEMSVEEYVSVLNVHLVGAFALTKAFVPQMKELGHGRILFQASMTSYIGQPQVAGYSTAKAGYLGLIHTLTAELAEYGITVNAIAPGWIDTPMFHKATDNDPPRLAKIMGRIPAKTVGDPMDVGMCAAFLCSEAARYISGTCIPVDGGALIGF
ncbi:MAG: SDR family oxidoreductase [Lachnospiraceae bacterium]|nr:SDR family oxidoreductase [Lachnospiraceae bacterium]MCI8959954.1 SDR family oxidoreductase [Lachnospiraceae bacterium]